MAREASDESGQATLTVAAGGAAEESDTGETATDRAPDYRIAPELKRNLATVKANDRAEFAFVERMEPVSDDVVEVTFVLPFGEETFSQRFRRPAAPETYALPSLPELYDAAEASVDDPESILRTSVPLEAAEGHEIDHGDGASVDPAWLPADVTLLPDRDIGPMKRWVPRLTGGLSLAATVAAFVSSGVWAGIGVGVVTVLAFGAALQWRDEYAPPPDAEPVTSPWQIEEGDVLVFDDSTVTEHGDRRLVRVVGIDGAFLDQTYDEVHRLPLDTDRDDRWH